jgi:hypothetical protein
LEVEAHGAGIGAEEEAAVGIIMEGADLSTAFLLGDAAGVLGEAEALFLRPLADLAEHAFPLGDDDDFHIGV